MQENLITTTAQPVTPVAGDGAEKRRYPRYTIDVAVKVRVNSIGGVTSYCYGRGNNLSQGGMSIHVAHELAVGKVVRLILTLPHAERQIECDAVVRGRDSYRYGLEFVNMSAPDRELVERACKMLGVLQVV
jgi:c-di-GMP-binding flagellar brake protein YcgR